MQEAHIANLSGIAVASVAPEKFWDFSWALFENQKEYYDEACAQVSMLGIHGIGSLRIDRNLLLQLASDWLHLHLKALMSIRRLF